MEQHPTKLGALLHNKACSYFRTHKRIPIALFMVKGFPRRTAFQLRGSGRPGPRKQRLRASDDRFGGRSAAQLWDQLRVGICMCCV